MNTTYSICRLERPRKAPSAIKLTRLFPTSSLSSTPRFANPDSSSLDRWLEDRLLWEKQEGNNKYISAKRWLQTGSAVVMLHVSYFKKTNKTELPFVLLFIFPDQPYLQSVCRDQILHQKRICESLRIYFFFPQSKLWWEQIKIAEHVHNPQATCLLSGLCDKSEKKWGKRGRKKEEKKKTSYPWKKAPDMANTKTTTTTKEIQSARRNVRWWLEKSILWVFQRNENATNNGISKKNKQLTGLPEANVLAQVTAEQKGGKGVCNILAVL